MRLSEVFLRIGSSLVGWMIVYAWFIWLAVADIAGCGAEGDEIYRLLLGMAPIAAGSALLLRVTRPFEDIHRMLRWLAVPLALLLFKTLPVIWSVFNDVNLGGNSICAGSTRSGWQVAWAPVQAVVTVVCAFMVALVWRSSSHTDAHDD